MDEIIRILESLENSNGLIDGAAETVKHEIEKQEDEPFCYLFGTNAYFIDNTCSFFIDKRNFEKDRKP